MANPTTNYGFVLPTSSDLVTDLPADFDVALQGVDTRLKALNPSTTLGDISYASATANTNTRRAIGTTGQVLTVAGGVPTWATPAGATLGGLTLLNAGGTALTGATTITVSGISNVSRIMVVVSGGSSVNAGSVYDIRFNGDSGGNYGITGLELTTPSTIGSGFNFARAGFLTAITGNVSTNTVNVVSHFIGTGGAGFVQGTTTGSGNGTAGNIFAYNGWYNASAAITSVSLISSNGNFDAGTLFVYGA